MKHRTHFDIEKILEMHTIFDALQLKLPCSHTRAPTLKWPSPPSIKGFLVHLPETFKLFQVASLRIAYLESSYLR
jgi:hypothetical protein